MQKTRIPRGEETFIFTNNSPGRPVGTLWKGLYQFQGTVYRIADAVVLAEDEWTQIKDADKLEMVNGPNLQRFISGDLARKGGYELYTPKGYRWAIPIDLWTEPITT